MVNRIGESASPCLTPFDSLTFKILRMVISSGNTRYLPYITVNNQLNAMKHLCYVAVMWKIVIRDRFYHMHLKSLINN